MKISKNVDRLKLDRIVSDETIPTKLKRDLKAGLKTLDALEALSYEASCTARDLLDARDEYRRQESGRIVNETVAGRVPTVEDVLSEFHVFEANHALAVQRAGVLKRSVLGHWQTVNGSVFRSHAIDLLTATAEAVVSGEPVSENLNNAWTRVEGCFRWHLPMIHEFYRFSNLRAVQPTGPMKKCWQAILSGDFATEELPSGQREFRFIGYWPEYTEPPR